MNRKSNFLSYDIYEKKDKIKLRKKILNDYLIFG